MRYWTILVGLALLSAAAAAPAAPAKTRVLVVTGGHGFDRQPFEAMLNALEGITWREAMHPKAHAWFKAEAARDWDVLVLYDQWQKIAPEAQADLVALLQAGKGVVALHHCLGGYDDWPEYERIIGGRYWHAKNAAAAGRKPSTYRHDTRFTVTVADPEHPVTKGVGELQVTDETYRGFSVAADAVPLLKTTEPSSGPTVGWTHRYGRSQVVYIELGHDRLTWDLPAFRRLLGQAIAFVRERSPGA
jgi:type 1 glutamine amidotransferase